MVTALCDRLGYWKENVMHTAQRKVLVTERKGGSFTKGTGYDRSGTTVKPRRNPRDDWHGDEPIGMPSQQVLDKIADDLMAGLTKNSPTKGARHAAICPACHVQHRGECY